MLHLLQYYYVNLRYYATIRYFITKIVKYDSNKKFTIHKVYTYYSQVGTADNNEKFSLVHTKQQYSHDIIIIKMFKHKNSTLHKNIQARIPVRLISQNINWFISLQSFHHIRVPWSSTGLKTWLLARWVNLKNTSLYVLYYVIIL